MINLKSIIFFVIILGVICAVFFSRTIKIEAPSNHMPLKEEKSKNQMDEYIVISNPLNDQIIKSPIKLSGKAKGNWFFEGSAPVQVIDENGVMIGQKYITTEGEWMTTDFVPFSGEVSFTVPQGMKNGFILFLKDNPSGDPKFDMSFMIPVRFE